jgi:hypothetical protein
MSSLGARAAKRFVRLVQSVPQNQDADIARQVGNRGASFRMASQDFQNCNLKTHHTPPDETALKCAMRGGYLLVSVNVCPPFPTPPPRSYPHIHSLKKRDYGQSDSGLLRTHPQAAARKEKAAELPRRLRHYDRRTGGLLRSFR